MQTRPTEIQTMLGTSAREQDELRVLVRKMIGEHKRSTKSLQERRREIAEQLPGQSVSQMIIESR